MPKKEEVPKENALKESTLKEKTPEIEVPKENTLKENAPKPKPKSETEFVKLYFLELRNHKIATPFGTIDIDSKGIADNVPRKILNFLAQKEFSNLKFKKV